MRARQALAMALALAAAGMAAAEERGKDKDLLPMRVVEALTCRSVRDSGELLAPVDAADRFSTSEKQVTAFVRFQHVLKPHKVQWRWYGPDGNLYTQSSELPVQLQGKYHEFFTAAHSILVEGEKAMILPGQWKVAVFLDGVVAATTSFTLSSRDATP